MFEPLMDFVKKSAENTDIFCFQEILSSPTGMKESRGARANIFEELASAMPDFQSYLSPEQRNFDLSGRVNSGIIFGQATFVRKTIKAESSGTVFVFGEENGGHNMETLPASFQYLRLRKDGRKLIICNFHGMAYPGDKLDNEYRLEQSRKIKDFLERERGAKILCGDFNLLPETQSIKMLEENMINLIKKFGIKRTRSHLSPFYGKSGFQPFADYAFVSPDVNVINFNVPDVDVSDHLPLVLEFS